jgi:hypothetical protein
VYFGLLVATPVTKAKLNGKHNITTEQVRAAIQWPARLRRAKWDDHPRYGRRMVTVGDTQGKPVLCILKPIPEYDENADTWEIQTARWLR